MLHFLCFNYSCIKRKRCLRLNIRQVSRQRPRAQRTVISASSLMFIQIDFTGVSANADPHTYKLRTRVAHIRGYRRHQPNRSAMEGPPPGETAWVITVLSVPGKYALPGMRNPFEKLSLFDPACCALIFSNDSTPLKWQFSFYL